ncbi:MULTISPECIES: response regulator transcription factor [Niastella]|uniref:Response regulator transcription factor n=1 Tax=Niastella soli TaxID=2821487 RepID=A0ABS3YZV5_9BACT|nr:response regulator transcription factor [Niastella soli]MBO9203450.1 response regulator transcription factor [Niastella soli]
MKRKKIRMAIAEDHQTVIDGILSLLHKHENFKAVIITTNPQELLRQMASTPVDILFADITMFYRTGHQLTNKVKELFPGVKMVALFEREQNNMMNAMIEEGSIAGYVQKNTDKHSITKALENMIEKVYLNDKTLNEMPNPTVRLRKVAPETTHLTDRELEVVRLIEQEYSNKQIAERLFISERTVETHRKNIFRKTKTNSVIGLIKYAYNHKLVNII